MYSDSPISGIPVSGVSENSTQLSHGAVYYLRKILRQNIDQLAFVVAEGAGLKADPLSDLNAVLNSLYLEDDELMGVVDQLERLSMMHQNLINQGSKHRQKLRETEEKIFWLLGFKSKAPSHQGTILIVDDVPDNLRLLSAALTKHGFEVPSAINGTLALSAVRELTPDLILLDIMMPGMDGYEVCEKLKASPETRDIPVIFISAMDDAMDKVRGFEIGGTDYVTKPFQIEEVLARVEHQMKLRSLQKRLEEQNTRFQAELHDRQQAEDQYRNIFEHSGDGIFRTSPEGKFVKANQALATMYGYESPEELIAAFSDIAKQLYVKPDQRDRINTYIKQHGFIADSKSEVYCKDGSTIWIAEKIRPVYNHENVLLYYEGTVQNITERKKLELELKQLKEQYESSEEIEALTAKLSGIASSYIALETAEQSTSIIAEKHKAVTLLSADLAHSSDLAQQLEPQAFVDLINQIFTEFKRIAGQNGLQTVKTMNDVYLVVGGLTGDATEQAKAVVETAIAMQKAMSNFQLEDKPALRLRIGIHLGEAIVGFASNSKECHDIWGEAVNTTHQMRIQSLPGGVQVTPTIYQHLQDRFNFKERGTIQVPGVGEIITYWLRGKNVAK